MPGPPWAGLGLAISVWLSSGPIGWIIGGIAVGVLAIVGAIWAMTAGNMDDIFEQRKMLLILDQVTLQGDPFYGQSRSQTQSYVQEGVGGRYEVHYYWQLVQALGGAPGDSDQLEGQLSPG
jgi:hypothetical protein